MGKKRHTKDFRIPGKVRYEERNPRGKNAEWIDFACTKDETDAIISAIGAAIQQTTKCELPAGTLLARICHEWQALAQLSAEPVCTQLKASVKELLEEIVINYEKDVKKGVVSSSQDFVAGRRHGRQEASDLAKQALALLAAEPSEFVKKVQVFAEQNPSNNWAVFEKWILNLGKLLKEACDIIERQDAENERLKWDVETLATYRRRNIDQYNQIVKLHAEIADLKKALQ